MCPPPNGDSDVPKQRLRPQQIVKPHGRRRCSSQTKHAPRQRSCRGVRPASRQTPFRLHRPLAKADTFSPFRALSPTYTIPLLRNTTTTPPRPPASSAARTQAEQRYPTHTQKAAHAAFSLPMRHRVSNETRSSPGPPLQRRARPRGARAIHCRRRETAVRKGKEAQVYSRRVVRCRPSRPVGGGSTERTRVMLPQNKGRRQRTPPRAPRCAH